MSARFCRQRSRELKHLLQTLIRSLSGVTKDFKCKGALVRLTKRYDLRALSPQTSHLNDCLGTPTNKIKLKHTVTEGLANQDRE